jgi:hypothetical protein
LSIRSGQKQGSGWHIHFNGLNQVQAGYMHTFTVPGTLHSVNVLLLLLLLLLLPQSWNSATNNGWLHECLHLHWHLSKHQCSVAAAAAATELELHHKQWLATCMPSLSLTLANVLLLLLLPQSWNSAMRMAGYMYAFTFAGTASVQNKLVAGATRRSGLGLPDEAVWPRTVALPRDQLPRQPNGRPMRLRANSESP